MQRWTFFSDVEIQIYKKNRLLFIQGGQVIARVFKMVEFSKSQHFKLINIYLHNLHNFNFLQNFETSTLFFKSFNLKSRESYNLLNLEKKVHICQNKCINNVKKQLSETKNSIKLESHNHSITLVQIIVEPRKLKEKVEAYII